MSPRLRARRTVAVVAVAAGLATSFGGSSSAVALPCLERGDAADPDVARLLADAGIVADPSLDRAPAGTLARFAEGLAALPCRLRAVPGGPLRVVWDPSPAPWGMAAGAARAEWRDDGRTFVLHAYSEPTDDPRATWADEQVGFSEREARWRRRAAVHAVVSRWDAARGWSRTTRWRRIAGFRNGAIPGVFPSEAFLDHPVSFARARGRTGPAEDLATFAEQLFVTGPEVAADDRPECVDPVRFEVFAEAVAREGLGRLPRAACPALDAHLSDEGHRGFEVLFAAPSSVRPETLFGHVFLRAIEAEGPLVRGPSFDRVFELAAITGTPTDFGAYLFRGLFGGFFATFDGAPVSVVLERNNREEQRTLRRFVLDLTPERDRRLRARLWQLERRGYVGYRFLDRNCAGLLLFAIEGILDEDERLEWPNSPFVMPAAALDSLRRVFSTQRRSPTSLIGYVVPDVVASREAASDAARRLLDPSDAAGVSKVGEGVLARVVAGEDGDSEVRAWLDALATPIVSGDDEALLSRRTITELTRLLRYEADRTGIAARGADLRRVLPGALPTPPDADSLLAERLRRYRHEDREAREAERVTTQLRAHAALREAPRRPATEDEQRTLELARAARERMVAVASLAPQLLDPTLAAEPIGAAAQGRAGRGIPGSGAGRSAFSVGAASGTSGEVAIAQWRSSLHAELLGEERQHGFGPGGELRLFDATTTWSAGQGGARLSAVDAIVLGFRTLPAAPTVLRRSLLDHVGFGLELGATVRSDRPDPVRSLVTAELLVPIGDVDGGTFVAAIAGIAGGVRGTWLPSGAVVGGRIGALYRHQAPGRSGNALLVSAFAEPRRVVGGANDGRDVTVVRASLEGRWMLDERTAIGPTIEWRHEQEPEGRYDTLRLLWTLDLL